MDTAKLRKSSQHSEEAAVLTFKSDKSSDSSYEGLSSVLNQFNCLNF